MKAILETKLYPNIKFFNPGVALISQTKEEAEFLERLWLHGSHVASVHRSKDGVTVMVIATIPGEKQR